ncbi:MAG: AsmA family protein, partial [Polaromonas sp.]
LAKAVKTVGLSRGGQTPLDTLAGQVSTQGRAAQLSNLVASSGALSATGNVAISPAKALSGRVTVAVAGDSKIGSAIGGAVGVPLTVGGTLDNPEVTLSRSALLGAAIGTALLPGVGTGAGANLGDRMGEGLRGLFGK